MRNLLAVLAAVLLALLCVQSASAAEPDAGAPGALASGPSATSEAGASPGPTASDAGVDSGSPSGFGPCVTQADIDGQSSLPFEVGFCGNPFLCFLCDSDAVNPGDIVAAPSVRVAGPFGPGDVAELQLEGIGVLRNPVARR